MEAIMEAVFGHLMKCLCSSNVATRSVSEVCKHVISPTKEIEGLRKKFTELIACKNDVERRIHNDEVVEGKTPTDIVRNWMQDVEKVMSKMDVMEDQVKEAKTCLQGLLPDCCLRSKLGNRISNLIREVVTLSAKGGCFLNESLPLSLSKVNKGTKLSTTRLVGKTAETNVKMVMDQLLDPNVGKIGVYGMGGAGKTTILKEVYNQLIEERIFHKAIWVTVSKDASVEKIQNHIAKELELSLSNEDDKEHRSTLLLDTLKRNKKIVITLDDMWESFSLHVIGIPEPTQENGCKIILTSRSVEVCRRMRCHNDNIIQVKLPSKEEAWELFMNKVGIDVTPEITEIAKDVIDECAYLPLAIIAIGEVMTGNDDISEWRVTLKNLRESTYRIIDMEEKVLKCLIFSYEQLIDEKIKDCFLYCALYPEDYRIDPEELVDYWIVEGLIQENCRQDELDQGQVTLNKLKNRCLLESDIEYGVECVKMHDLIREMALYITKERFIAKAGVMENEIQCEDEWSEDLERASFMNCEVTKISITPKCPKLSTLFLNENRTLCMPLPPDFFVHMKGLKVLNLEGNSEMTMLPNSISDLVNLSALYLSGCESLEEIPSLAKLTSLRTLELHVCGIKELPHGMENLVNLRHLSLHHIPLRETLPAGLIAKLSRLEELYLFQYNLQFLYKVGGEKRFVDELLSLKHLESLHVGFACWSHLISYVGSPMFGGLKKFSLVVGNEFDNSPFFRSRREVISYAEEDDIPENALMAPRNTESLTLRRWKNLVNIAHLSTRCPELRGCWIEWCKNLEYVFSFSQEGKEDEVEHEGIVLPHLEKLGVLNCFKLESLCKGIPTPGTLLYLKKLEIYDCPNMKNVFSSTRLLEQLQHLEDISIGSCDGIGELIASEEEEQEERMDIISIPTISLPKLKTLKLWYLPKMNCIWKGGMVCGTLQLLEIRCCDELKKLPQLRTPSLQVFRGSSQEWWDSLEWDDDDSFLRSHLHPLFRV